MKQNKYRWNYEVEGLDDEIKTNKKTNVEYWDLMEGVVEDFIRTIADFGGLTIPEQLNGDADIFPVKVLTEKMTQFIQEYFPEAEFPYVDEDF